VTGKGQSNREKATMTIRAIPLGESFFPKTPTISVYDVVFPVVSLSPDGKPLKLIGTCFALGSCGLYATAAHLFDKFGAINQALRVRGEINEFHEVDHKERIDPEKMKCGIVHFHRNYWLGITLVDALSMCIAQDVAFLVSANDCRGRNQPRLSIIESPAKGDDILVVGYPGSHNSMQVVGGDAPELSFDLALVDSAGKIEEAFPVMRDPLLAFYPCFSTSASMRSGQSGGPVIDMDKMGVVGVNSRSIEGEDNYCIASWLGMALDVSFGFDNVEFRNDSGEVIPVKKTTLRLLAEHGVVTIV
jgi:hypothetical protein